VANSDSKTFQEFMAEGMESMTKTAFPQLSKFMDFSREKMKNEDKTSDSISSSEDDIGTPNKRRRKSASADTVANEMVLDSLGAIDERLKVQSIVLVSQLEQQTITNQLLGRLAAGGGGFGAVGGGSGGGSGGGVADAALEAAGGASIGNFIKSWGTKLLGGAASLLMSPAGALAAGGVAGVVGAETIRRTDHNEDVSPTAPTKTGADLQAEIATLKADIEREKQHLALNPTDAATIAILKKLEEKLDKDLNKDQTAESTPATPQHNWGPWHFGGTPSGPIINNPADVPTSVSTPMSGQMPPLHSGYVPNALPQGTNPLDIVRHGGGTIAGGGAGGGAHPAGVGGTRSNSGGRASGAGSAANKGEAWNFFKSKGYSDEETAAIMGNLQQESHFDPNANNPNDAGPGLPSEGIAQWNRKRRDQMMEFASEQFGKPYGQLTNAEKYTGQLGFVDHELHTKDYAGALKSLKSGDYKKFGHQFEGYGSPPDLGGENTREANAQRLLREGRSGKFSNNDRHETQEGGSVAPNFTPPKDTGEVLDHIAKARSLNLINGEECVALAAGAVGVRLDHQHGIGSQVSDWRRGAPAADGKLAVGSPVATFHKRDGTIGNRYAEGSAGGGDPGADLDHAGVIVGYDKDGKGMTIADQWGGHTRGGKTWGGSGPNHTTHVTNDGMVTRADGSTYYSREHDIHRYFGINTEQGPLGGRNNPNTPFVDLHRGPSGPNKYQNRYRPEDSMDGGDAGYQAARAQYEDQMTYARDAARGHQGYGRTDTQKTTAAQLVHNSNTEAVNAAAQAKHAASVNIHQMHASTGGAHSLTPAGKSDRLSDRDVGSANPPPQRLSELFTSGPSAKTWG
jgi:hypothetical protein